MKKFSIILLLLLIGCSKSIAIPDLRNIDEMTAKTTISNIGLIPAILYDYSDLINEGYVIATDPSANEKVEENTRVNLIVSKGKRLIVSKDAVIQWRDVSGSSGDSWSFYAPLIEEGVLKIEVEPEINTRHKFEWLRFGHVSVSETTEKSVPITFIRKDASYEISFSIDDLEIKRPTTLYVSLRANINDVQTDVPLVFRISW